MLNVIKFNMESFFHNGVKNYVLKFCQLRRVIAPQDSSLHKNQDLFHSISYYLQNIKTELKNIFLFRRDSSSKLHIFLIFFFKFSHFMMTSPCNYGNHWLSRMIFFTSIMGCSLHAKFEVFSISQS